MMNNIHSGGAAIESPATALDPARAVLGVGPAISWRGIAGGVVVALLAYTTLVALGFAIGGAAAERVVENESGGSALGWASGVWLLVSTLAALFVGGYVAARASGVMPHRVGGVEGLVVSALFFGVMFFSAGAAIGKVGNGVGSLLSAAGGAAADIAKNPAVQSVVERSLGDVPLKASIGDVSTGVLSRLLRGDNEAAKAYLARQTGLSAADADARLQRMTVQVKEAATTIGVAAARAAQIAGWVLFAALLLGSTASFFGGFLGMHRNIQRPVSERDRATLRESRGAWLANEATTPVPAGVPFPNAIDRTLANKPRL